MKNKKIFVKDNIYIIIISVLILIFFFEIIFSFINYLLVLKRPVLFRTINREGINPKNFSIYGDFLFMTDFSGNFLRQVNKNNGEIVWEYKDKNIVDAIMDRNGNIYILIENPSKLIKFSNHKKSGEIFLNSDLIPNNMILDKNDNIYISNKKDNKIYKFNLLGQNIDNIYVDSENNKYLIGKITVDFNDRLFVVVKPGIVKEFDIRTKEKIQEKLIPYLTKGDIYFNLIYVKRAENNDLYINDHAKSRMLIFNENWKLKGIFYQDARKMHRFIACGPFDIDNNLIYINNYIIFVYPLI